MVFAKVSHNDPAHNACGAHRCVTYPLYEGVSHNEGRQEAHRADGRGTLWRNSESVFGCVTVDCLIEIEYFYSTFMSFNN